MGLRRFKCSEQILNLCCLFERPRHTSIVCVSGVLAEHVGLGLVPGFLCLGTDSHGGSKNQDVPMFLGTKWILDPELSFTFADIGSDSCMPKCIPVCTYLHLMALM